MKFKHLFSSGKIGTVNLKNRIVRSATYDGRSDRGFVTEDHIQFYEELAQGGVGLIVSGATVVDASGSGGKTQPYLFNDSFMEGQKRLVNAVHDYSEVRFAVQLMHMGRQTIHPKFPPIGPSAVPNKSINMIPKEISKEEVEYFIQAFVDAGRRAYECGYDMIQLHAAHDYFLNNFLCPYTNRREDEYGGSTENRTRILVKIYQQLREEIAKSCPIIIKLQTIDGFPGGIDLEEAKKIADILVKTGFDAIEPSGGSSETMNMGDRITPFYTIDSPEEENYFHANAKNLRTIEDCCPLILVGGVRNPITADKFIEENIVDFIAMSRPFIREPNLPNRWREGDSKPAKCISCNACYGTMIRGKVYCVPKRRLQRRKRRAAKSRKI